MKRFRIGLCAGVAVMFTAPVQAFTANNGVRVNSVDAGVFEVVPVNSGTVDEFWCGAAEYARRVLGAGWQDRIYVVRGRDESVTTGKRSAAQFTLLADRVPEGAAERGWFTIGLRAGDALSVQAAQTHCPKITDRF